MGNMKTMQIIAIVLSALLALSASPCHGLRTLLAANTVQITNGEVSSAAMERGVPAGRACVGSGMHCSSSSQCCSKACSTIYFRCG